MVLRAPAIGTSFSTLAKNNITFSLDEADDSPEKPNSLLIKSPLGHYVDAHGS